MEHLLVCVPAAAWLCVLARGAPLLTRPRQAQGQGGVGGHYRNVSREMASLLCLLTSKKMNTDGADYKMSNIFVTTFIMAVVPKSLLHRSELCFFPSGEMSG